MRKPILTITTLFYAFVFSVNAQEVNQKFKAEANKPGNQFEFGHAVSISDEFAIVGSHFDWYDENDTNEMNHAGSAFFYRKVNGDWEFFQKVVDEDRLSFEEFGYATLIDGECAYISKAYGDYNETGSIYRNGAGIVHVYDFDGTEWVDEGENARFTSTKREEDENFGLKMDASSNYIIVNSRRRAYVYPKGTGCNVATFTGQALVPLDTAQDKFIGAGDVAITNNYAVVGAPFNSYDQNNQNMLDGAGAVHAFEYNANTDEWEAVQKIVPSDRQEGDRFGGSVVLHKDQLFVGAGAKTINGESLAGQVYVYDRNNGEWVLSDTLQSSTPSLNGYFGSEMHGSGDYLIIGSYGEGTGPDDVTVNLSGAAFVFARNGAGKWTERARFVADDREFFDRFGTALWSDGRDVIVGCHDKDAGGFGTAYFFRLPNYSVGIENVADVKEAKIYPNPAKEEVNLSLGTSSTGEVDVNVYDAQGSLVMNTTSAANGGLVQISVASLADGAYQVISTQDGVTYRSLLIKQ